MCVDVKGIAIHFGKAMISAVRVSLGFMLNHPFVVVTVTVSHITHRFLPSVFAFFVSSSPVIICTALLILLSAGQQNASEAEEEAEKTDSTVPSLKADGAAADPALEKTERFGVRRNIRKRSGSAGKAKNDMGLPLGEKRGSLTPKNDGKDDSLLGVKKVIAEHGFEEKREFHEDKQGGIAKGHFLHEGKRTTEPSSGIPDVHLADHGESSNSDSDHAESCSPDASVAEMAPKLDELDPLLDDEPPQQLAPSPRSTSGSASQRSSSLESENDSDEEIEGAENWNDVKEDEKGKDDETEAVVKWTADDEKNLHHLGTSDLERNQRLENLTAKRIASKKPIAAATEKNLINLDSNYPIPMRRPPITEQFPHFQVPPPVFTTQRNPFDLPYRPIPDLPMAPGSAPSVLLPRRNPFDLPYDEPKGENPMSASSSRNQVESIPLREIFFRRHESFSLGASAPMKIRKDRPRRSDLKPYFVAEQVAVDEGILPTLQRQLSGESDSSISESDTSSVVDQLEDHEELYEQEPNQSVQPNSYMEKEENEHSEDASSRRTQQDQGDLNVDIMGQYKGSNASYANSEMHEDGCSASSSIQSDKKIFETVAFENSNSHQATKQGAPSTASIGPVQVVHEVLQTINYRTVKESTYHSSPLSAAKSSSSALLKAAVAGAESDLSKGVSSFVPVERIMLLEDEAKQTALAKKNWVASTSLSFVDRDESRSREISKVSEATVIQAVLESSTEAKPSELNFVHPEFNQMG